MTMTIDQKIEYWTSATFDETTRQEVRSLKEEEAALKDAFYKDLSFGTGGMRGKMGVGTNRINKYTLGRATQGLANYLNTTHHGTQSKVIIAYDSRHNSQELAQIVADVLAANSIEAFLFSDLRTTPELSFAVRYFQAQAGIVLTASHNPPEYNGYKVYGPDGGQIVPPLDAALQEAIGQVAYEAIQFDPPKAPIRSIDIEVDRAYWETVLDLMPPLNTKERDLKIVFTSLHGTAITAIPKVLQLAGFNRHSIVKEQMHPDGDFPTVISPNPEEPEALSMALALAKKESADIVIGTDPDCDRLGVGVRDNDGCYHLLDGNQLMILLTDYILTTLRTNNQLPAQGFIATTIVSTPIMASIANHFGLTCVNTLTGFKWIADAIEKKSDNTFICGGEESYGFLVGTPVRDKDAVSAALLTTYLAQELKAKGKNLIDQLLECYTQYGFSLDRLLSYTKEGPSGQEEINNCMMQFRTNPPKTFSGSPLIRSTDYLSGIITDWTTRQEHPTGLPTADVLIFEWANGCRMALRPSGTEPKIKFYLNARGTYTLDQSWEKNKTTLTYQLDALEAAFGL